MSRDLKLFVVDTGPLITLAAAQSLDYLLYVDADVVIPDAVLHEATRDVARITAPALRDPDLGERSAVEVIEEPDRLQGSERGLLLCEETAVLKRVVVRERERIVEISTLDFLRILEAEQRIQSAEQVFEIAEKAGRSPSRAAMPFGWAGAWTPRLAWNDTIKRAEGANPKLDVKLMRPTRAR